MRDDSLFEILDDLLMSDREHFFTDREIFSYIEDKSMKIEKLKGNGNWSALGGVFEKMKRILKKEYSATFEFKNGRDRGKGFRYPRGLENPMEQYRTKHRQMRIKMLERLFKQSKGLLPPSWLADAVAQKFVSDDEIIIGFDRKPSKNLQWVPTVFEAIKNHKVLSFKYRPRYGEKVVNLHFHPYFLKEHNGCWFAFGHAEYEDGKAVKSFCCSLDRIDGKISIVEDAAFVENEGIQFSSDYFNDIVGVTRYNKRRQTITIEVLDEYTFWRIRTKKLHQSQKKLRDFSDTQTGLFSIDVIQNNELDTLLFSFGPNIKVVGDEDYVKHFQSLVEKLNNLYNPIK